jgi:integrase
MGRPKKEKQDVKINKNQIRDRALKLPEVTDSMYVECNSEIRDMLQEYFDNNPQLSPDTKKQYWSCLRQFAYWVHTSCNDKPLYKISKRDFNRYMSYLVNRGMSSSALGLKKSAVSTVCNYIENVVSEDDEKYEKFRNITKGFSKIPKNHVYEKVAITEEEFNKIIEVLKDDENYMGICWATCAFYCGARRGGLRGFKSELSTYVIPEDKNFINTHFLREKGSGYDGNVTKYMLSQECLDSIKTWIEKREYEHEYLFTVKYGGEYRRISKEWANEFCTNVLSDILQRRITPHLFKGSAVTNYLAKGHDIKVVSKFIAHHKDISTTMNFYDLRNQDDEANDLFK